MIRERRSSEFGKTGSIDAPNSWTSASYPSIDLVQKRGARHWMQACVAVHAPLGATPALVMDVATGDVLYQQDATQAVVSPRPRRSS